MSDKNFDLQVILTTGTEDPERVTLGLAAALAAASSDQRVVVFFSVRGAQWASPVTPEHPKVGGFPSIAEIVEMLVELDVSLVGCTSCIDLHLKSDLGESGHRTMATGFSYGGLSEAALRMSDVPTVTF